MAIGGRDLGEKFSRPGWWYGRLEIPIGGGEPSSKAVRATILVHFVSNRRILNGQPKQMGLKELLQIAIVVACYKCPEEKVANAAVCYMKLMMALVQFVSQAFLDFRCSVIERRARFKLAQAQERMHIVEGIITGLDNLDEVIQVIRKASSNAIASEELMKKYSLSQKQAEAILDMNLRKLTVLERNKFVDESKSLMEQISRLEKLLSSKKQILQLIEQEAIELKNKFATPRRSILEEADSQVEDIDVIPNEEMLLAVSEKGYVKRMKPNTFNPQNRGTIGKSVGKMRVNDMMSDFLVCRAHDHRQLKYNLYAAKRFVR
ncbi:hypothetical protein Cgig2_030458 [Carnegiea gigantea]|uniref:DNA topoisomerase (ATP-hydrolyzing) n=1 Tax=Carnegiea gigantea TaxID=171969 RepID=A0A9Q1KR81_9CARY|nr:hypothetical protein Cgig2_030458 [Carnegiea gigantea]